MDRSNFENLDVYKLAEYLSDSIWDTVLKWDDFARSTVGRQIVRAADSIGANIAEGAGKGSFKDNKRFVRMARGSLNETIYWLERTRKRELIASDPFLSLKSMTNELAPRLNAYLKSIGKGFDKM
ncbi:MAG TPA: four helix bundle protein [Balneolales bacterium]|nr:four helix bundle protein [Balneolales bacterium]